MQKAIVWAHALPVTASMKLSRLQDELLSALGILDEAVHVIGHRHRSIMEEQNRKAIYWDSYVGQQARALKHTDNRKVEYRGFDCTRGINEAWSVIRALNQTGTRDDVVVSAAAMADALLLLFEGGDVKCALNWNQWQYAQRLLKAASDRYKVPHIYLEQGLLPHTLCADVAGVAAESSLTPAKWKSLLQQGLSPKRYNRTSKAIKTLRARTESIIKQDGDLSGLEIDAGKPVLFVVGQIDSDSNILRFSGKYPTNMSVLRALRPELDRYNIIYKPHPRGEASQIDRIAYAFPEIGITKKGDINKLFSISSAVITRNSTVGLEALIKGVPVITLAESIYAARGITMDAKLKGFSKCISGALKNNYWNERRVWKRTLFFDWLFHEHLWWSKEHEPVEGLHEYSVERIRSCLKLG